MLKTNEIMFAERLRQRRRAHQMTQDDLAEKVKIGKTTISAYENAKSPSIKALIRISSFFGKTTDYMVGLTENSLPINHKHLQLPLIATDEHYKLVHKVYDVLLNSDAKVKVKLYSFAVKLQMLRIQRNVSQHTLGKELAISNSALSSYELGRSMPSVNLLHSLAVFFDVSLDYLVGITEIPFTIHDNNSEPFLLPLKDKTSDYQRSLLEKLITALFT